MEDLRGREFGKYKVVYHAHFVKGKHYWLCKCICGAIRVISADHLRSGKRTGCNSCNNGNKLRPYEALYRILLRNPHHEVNLSYEEFLVFTKIRRCHYCGTKVRWAKSLAAGSGYNLDRKHTNYGYSKHNCVVCCARCNWAKGDHFSYDEWVLIGNLIRSWQK